MKNKAFALKGNICYSKNRTELRTIRDGYVICEDGLSLGAYDALPPRCEGIAVTDCGDSLILPGLIDLHTHASQFVFRAVGLDLELLEWLESTAFPQEAKYADPEYAKAAYGLFVQDAVKGPNTRMNLFATRHVPATVALMDLLEESGLVAHVGKVNMDRNAPACLCEGSAQESADATCAWLEAIRGKYKNVSPILTPRFIPSCSDELLEMLGSIQNGYGLPVQSHLSENMAEIDWVKDLHPDCPCYGDAYQKYGLFETDGKTVMAHCVHCPDAELELMKKHGVFVAHCAQSNANLSSGMVPVRRYLDMGLKVGLGSDVAGGYTTSILRAMADSIQMSKMLWREKDQSLKPLTLEEAFYLATLGGGAFFGKVGSFERGYEFDAVVIDDAEYHRLIELSVKERLERAMYLSSDRHITAKYVKGREIKAWRQ
jgi:guanine deaminase